MQQQSIFREKALEQLSSPEQLDQVMQVTPLRGWLALIALAAVVLAAVLWGIFGSIPIEVNAQGFLIGQEGIRRLVAPSAGTVTAHRRGGDAVSRGDAIVTIKTAQGQDIPIAAEYNGMVIETYVHTGFPVDAGAPVANVEPRAADLGAVLFVSIADAKQLQPGMTVHLSPSTVSPDQYGVLLGKVTYVSPFPASSLRLQALLVDPDLVQFVSRGGPVYEVAVQLQKDPSTASGFAWSSRGGPPTRLTTGTFTSADVVLGEQRPLGLVLPVFSQ